MNFAESAKSVTEDAFGINRTTQTLKFDVAGRAIKTQDASGKQFETTYDGDGNVLDVTRVDGVQSIPSVLVVFEEEPFNKEGLEVMTGYHAQHSILVRGSTGDRRRGHWPVAIASMSLSTVGL